LGSKATSGAEIGTHANELVRRSDAGMSLTKRSWWAHSTVRYVAVAAASVAATMLLQWLIRAPAPRETPRPPIVAASAPARYVATLSQAADTQWGAGTQAYQAGSRVLQGEFELRRGVARLAYDGGIELIVEGPARLRLQSATKGGKHSGTREF